MASCNDMSNPTLPAYQGNQPAQALRTAARAQFHGLADSEVIKMRELRNKRSAGRRSASPKVTPHLEDRIYRDRQESPSQTSLVATAEPPDRTRRMSERAREPSNNFRRNGRSASPESIFRRGGRDYRDRKEPSEQHYMSCSLLRSRIPCQHHHRSSRHISYNHGLEIARRRAAQRQLRVSAVNARTKQSLVVQMTLRQVSISSMRAPRTAKGVQEIGLAVANVATAVARYSRIHLVYFSKEARFDADLHEATLRLERLSF
jgi:hypothetical protein